ncbi:MAG: hypothetical protein E6G35_17980 [Actinobacteria bacterium]|nr:MAG: hypothetical protein E6G35_17980 [Actinomycetota bacterium]
MRALVRMRLLAYLRTGRFIVPLITTLVLLGILYGGGQAPPAEAYGVSALLLFPVLAWQAKLLLDAEPDAQRRIAVSALGSPSREVAAGLSAAALAALPLILLALVLPAVGGLASRVLTRTAGRGAAVLASGVVLAFVLGLHGSPVPWLAPPLVATARTMAGDDAVPGLIGLTGWALLWSAVAVAGYGWLRRDRI